MTKHRRSVVVDGSLNAIMNTNRTTRRIGDIVAIPLTGGGYAYGRVLDKLRAFYDLKTPEIVNVDTVIRQQLLFTTSVQFAAVTSGRWQVIGHRPLELALRGNTKFFRANPSGHGLLIYVSKPTPANAYEEYEATAEECLNLEPLLSWDANLLEDTYQTPVSRRLYGALAKIIVKNFGKVKSYYVGREAYALWQNGMRLGPSLKASADFDLKR